MQIIHSITQLRKALHACRLQAESIAFVPTMGNLHAGHLALVQRARQKADRVVVSIFVNPSQFGPGEDYDQYPRTLEQDCQLLQAEQVDWVFAPEREEIYPAQQTCPASVNVDAVSDILCGQFRPGHFRGVATVVSKLFNIVQPDVALFGEKDYQQWLVIRALVESLNYPIRLCAVPTVRDPDGLAMSSRNRYLNESQRELALTLIQQLRIIEQQLQQGATAYTELEEHAVQALQARGLLVDYIAIRTDLLQPPTVETTHWRVLGAVRIGNTRLIDNLAVSRLPAD